MGDFSAGRVINGKYGEMSVLKNVLMLLTVQIVPDFIWLHSHILLVYKKSRVFVSVVYVILKLVFMYNVPHTKWAAIFVFRLSCKLGT